MLFASAKLKFTPKVKLAEQSAGIKISIMKEKLCVRLLKSSWFKRGLNFTIASYYDMPARRACKV